METTRVEAFSDGVIAILITIMVLELRAPKTASLESLIELAPTFLSYLLSFVYLGIYWNNHHHMFYTLKRVTGSILWANLALLFFLSLVPFATSWLGETHFAPATLFIYGLVLLAASIAYTLLQAMIICADGDESLLKLAVGGDWKGKVSPLLYIIGIALAYISPILSGICYVSVAILWFIPDRRIEKVLVSETAPDKLK